MKRKALLLFYKVKFIDMRPVLFVTLIAATKNHTITHLPIIGAIKSYGLRLFRYIVSLKRCGAKPSPFDSKIYSYAPSAFRNATHPYQHPQNNPAANYRGHAALRIVIG